METFDIVKQLRDYDTCSDGDIDEAADMLEVLLSQFQMHSPNMNGEHSYRFGGGGWPVRSMKGPNVEDALRRVVREVQHAREQLKAMGE